MGGTCRRYEKFSQNLIANHEDETPFAKFRPQWGYNIKMNLTRK